MRIRYRDGYGSTTERLVRPIQLTNRYGDLYLVAHCYLRQGSRTFAVDRIQEMAIAEETDLLGR
jgi:predicted DNA-binding transcriptional regulator YafY